MNEMNKKYFIITIDTEGDNLWQWKNGMPITTNNTKYLQRFQDLCNKYGFKPVWLSNWEMINDSEFVSFIKRNLKENACELGMHLHAWNTPPYHELPMHDNSGAPYLIEYPKNIMEQKIASITAKMKEQFGFVPISHRAGRWAMNDDYFELLYKYGYEIDCSITPGINWKDSVGQTPDFYGVNYQKALKNVHMQNELIEVPVTVEYTHKMFVSVRKSFKENVKAIIYGIKGKNVWFRPNRENFDELNWLVDKNRNSNAEYLMFMLHSSELMPGENPTFRNSDEIEQLYKNLEVLFTKIQKSYYGITLEQYIKIRNATQKDDV